MLGLQAIVLLAGLLGGSEALRCASCTNVTHVSDCQNYVTCRQGERCYSTSFGIGTESMFDLGCKSEAECLSSAGPSIVGRSINNIQCSQCCAVDNCNDQLCSAGTQITNEFGSCADDPTFDCKHFSTVFNICGDIAHAKTACRKWCGLCDLVDGAWSLWASWSNCDVTCGAGHVTRSRSCTDPPPAHGGLTCSGNTTEVNTCSSPSPCPIHGGWSSWRSWSSCTNTCGIGTQSRHRLCDNPVPAIAGNHCFGDTSEYQACFERSCTDGGWSTWSPWAACNDGLKSRNRSCDSPAPSRFGKDCVGNDMTTTKCDHIAFTVNSPSGAYTANTLIFTKTVVNIGGGFDVSTGRFTCTTPGLYNFMFSLGIRGTNQVYCNIRKNSNAVTYSQAVGTTTYSMISTSTILQLSVGDVVDVGDCVNYQSIVRDYSGTFSGYLI